MTLLDQPAERVDLLGTFITKLADEGVPVMALSRGFNIPSAELRELLEGAKEKGQLIELPENDWRVGKVERATVGSSRGRNLNDLIALSARCYGLNRSQSVMFSAVLYREVITKDQLYTIYENYRPHGSAKSHKAERGPVDPKIIDVLICQARKQIKKFGIEIETVWGSGYAMRPACRSLAFNQIDAFLNGNEIPLVEEAYVGA